MNHGNTISICCIVTIVEKRNQIKFYDLDKVLRPIKGLDVVENLGHTSVQIRDLGRPCRDTSRNYNRASADPEFGCCNVSCSKVMHCCSLQQTPKMRLKEMVVHRHVLTRTWIRRHSRGQCFILLSILPGMRRYHARLCRRRSRVGQHDSLLRTQWIYKRLSMEIASVTVYPKNINWQFGLAVEFQGTLHPTLSLSLSLKSTLLQLQFICDIPDGWPSHSLGRALISALFSSLSSLPTLRAADPGEFTRQALLWGRLDLTQVEACMTWSKRTLKFREYGFWAAQRLIAFFS